MFTQLKKAVAEQFKVMSERGLYKVSLDKDKLWSLYLDSFPDGTNPIFKERREYDCNCCKQFIRAVGNVVTIINNDMISIWDVQVPYPYQTVVNALAKYVKSCNIENIFIHDEKKAGTDKNHQYVDGEVITWEHFYVEIPNKYYAKNPGTHLGISRSTYDVMLRGLDEITTDSVDTVDELISQNSLYRGEENKFAVSSFKVLKNSFMMAKDKKLFCWCNIDQPESVSRIRNTSIGTLLVDISNGIDLDTAVKSFELKVAPTNYKRPTAVVTSSMIRDAQETVEKLGLTSSLDRRYATVEDITVNNLIFASRPTKKAMNVFDELASRHKSKNLSKMEEITIEDFISSVVPKATSIELMVEHRHYNSFVSLIAPMHRESKLMFKWGNNFSWAYSGDLADSIKEKVKRAGGAVDGELCCRLAWYNKDDLDLHMIEPDGHEIYYGNKRRKSLCGGVLDVDANGGDGYMKDPVENIAYNNLRVKGKYSLFIHQYNRRETTNVGFEVEIEATGKLYSFSFEKVVKQGDKIKIADVVYDGKEVKVIPILQTTKASKEIWGIKTNIFIPVSAIMFSPNHWDNQGVGNRHYFFMLGGCKSPDKARGFFNEFLIEDLNRHRKVFEVLGDKMKAEVSDKQLSGIGFSSTKRDSVVCNVTGSFSRTLKVTF